MVQFSSDLAKRFVKLKSVCYLFQQPIDEKIKTWTCRFQAQSNLKTEKRYCSIVQSVPQFLFTKLWKITLQQSLFSWE